MDISPTMLRLITAVGPLFAAARLLQAQGTFSNLDFELAIVPDLPRGSDGGAVAIAEGLPGWRSFSESGEQNFVFHNGVSIGGSVASILGPNYASSQIIEGKYTAVLNAPI